MTIKFDAIELEHRKDGKTWLLLRPADEASLFDARKFFAKAKDKKRLYDAELKPHYEKRSLDANAYFWRLCDEIARAVGNTKDYVYREAIKSVGPFTDLYVPSVDAHRVSKAWEKNGLGWFTEFMETRGDYVTMRAYHGSSTYNTVEMSRLIDEIVHDAKELGIETKTPDEIAQMVSLWGER